MTFLKASTETAKELTEQEVVDLLLAKICRYGRRRRLQGQLAKEIGISDQMMSAVLHRKKKPSALILKFLKVERVTSYRLKA